MIDDERLQLAGPIGIIGAISCAEFGAHALAIWPTSSLLWFLNLEIFRPFDYSLNGFGITERLGTFNAAIWIAALLIILMGIGLVTKIRLPLAMASNLSLIYSLCLLYGCYTANGGAAMPGFKLSDFWCPSAALASLAILISLLSSTASHRGYWREIFP